MIRSPGSTGTAANRLHVADLFLSTESSSLSRERMSAYSESARSSMTVLAAQTARVAASRCISFACAAALRSPRQFPAICSLSGLDRINGTSPSCILPPLMVVDGCGFATSIGSTARIFSGVRRRGGWIGLSGAPFGAEVCIYAGVDQSLRGEASWIAGYVLELHDVRVRSANGRSRALSGSYFIARVDRAGVVTFREELDIDIPCGEDVSPPAIMPTTFRAPASAFFYADGRPRFAVKYTKGCRGQSGRREGALRRTQGFESSPSKCHACTRSDGRR
jgi:hypothetical protein